MALSPCACVCVCVRAVLDCFFGEKLGNSFASGHGKSCLLDDSSWPRPLSHEVIKDADKNKEDSKNKKYSWRGTAESLRMTSREAHYLYYLITRKEKIISWSDSVHFCPLFSLIII